jgi:hypothetical protein
MSTSGLQTIQWLQCFSGPRFFQHITVVTTKWDKHKARDITEARTKVQELKSDYLQLLLHPPHAKGGNIYHHGIPNGGQTDQDWEFPLEIGEQRDERSAQIKTFIHNQYGKAPGMKLQIEMELERNIPLMKTEAAKAYKAKPLDTDIRIHERWAIVTTTSPRASSSSDTLQVVPALLAAQSNTPENNPENLPYASEWLGVIFSVAMAFDNRLRDATAKLVEIANDMVNIIVTDVKEVANALVEGISVVWGNIATIFK